MIRQLVATGVIHSNFTLCRDGEDTWTNYPEVDLDAPAKRITVSGVQEWFYLEGEDRKGPFDFAVIQQLLQAGVIKPDAWVAKQGDDDWTPAEVALNLSSNSQEPTADITEATIPTAIADTSQTASRAGGKAFLLLSGLPLLAFFIIHLFICFTAFRLVNKGPEAPDFAWSRLSINLASLLIVASLPAIGQCWIQKLRWSRGKKRGSSDPTLALLIASWILLFGICIWIVVSAKPTYYALSLVRLYMDHIARLGALIFYGVLLAGVVLASTYFSQKVRRQLAKFRQSQQIPPAQIFIARGWSVTASLLALLTLIQSGLLFTTLSQGEHTPVPLEDISSQGEHTPVPLEDILIGTWNGKDGMRDELIFRKNHQFEASYFSGESRGDYELKIGNWRKTGANTFEYEVGGVITSGRCDESSISLLSTSSISLQHLNGSSNIFSRKENFVRKIPKLVKLPHEVVLKESQKMISVAMRSKMVSLEGGNIPRGTEVGFNSSKLVGNRVEPYMISRTEVTWDEWGVVRDYGNLIGYDLDGVGQGGGPTHPVTHVNWYEALKWCNALSEMAGLKAVYSVDGEVYRDSEMVPDTDPKANGYRLPTNAEWEWAAKGGKLSKGFTFSGSNEPSEVAWYLVGDTHPVGGKKPNELGIYDMSGNTREWCWDLSIPGYLLRIARGGACEDKFAEASFDGLLHQDNRATNCRVDNNNGQQDPSSKTNGWTGYGFRVAKNLGP